MRILLFSASLREDSTNRKLIQVAKQSEALSAHQVDLVDFSEFDVPLYDGDIETGEGIPEGALKLIDYLKSTDGLILSAPEYNFSVPGTLKNLIDWVSRESPMPWKNKPILLLSASPSLAGGSRGLLHTRVSLEVCRAYVYPGTFSLSNSYEAFNETGQLKDGAVQKRLTKLIADFVKWVEKLKD